MMKITMGRMMAASLLLFTVGSTQGAASIPPRSDLPLNGKSTTAREKSVKLSHKSHSTGPVELKAIPSYNPRPHVQGELAPNAHSAMGVAVRFPAPAKSKK